MAFFKTYLWHFSDDPSKKNSVEIYVSEFSFIQIVADHEQTKKKKKGFDALADEQQ